MNPGWAILFSMAKKSAIAKFLDNVHNLMDAVDYIQQHEIRVGWADEKKEQKRAPDKITAKALRNAKKSERLTISNFDENFVGPGLQAASLAAIAKTLCYGRAGGISAKTGNEYGEIPARNFVDVMRNNHMKPIKANARKFVESTLAGAKMNPADVVREMGVLAKGQLQRAMMDSSKYAPNAPITVQGGWMANVKNGKPFHVEGKGSNRPLWNHGTLINSVDFEIK